MKINRVSAAALISLMVFCGCDVTPEYPEEADTLPSYVNTGTSSGITIYDTKPPVTYTTPVTTTVTSKETAVATVPDTEPDPTETTTTVPFSLTLDDVPDVDLSEYQANTVSQTQVQTVDETSGVTSAEEYLTQTVSGNETEPEKLNEYSIFDTPSYIQLDDGRISSYTGREIISHPYSYYTLSEKHRRLYDKIVMEMLDCSSSISFDSSESYTFQDLYDVYQLLYNDEYRLFYISSTIEYVADSSTDHIVRMKPKYLFDKAEISKMKQEVYTEADKILSQITPEMNDYDIVKLFHDSIITSCTYNSDAVNPNSIYGCLVDKSALCQAYSKAFSYLCSEAGINSYLVIGVADEPHMWNIVEMDKEYYHIDLTWDDPDRPKNPDSIRYDYFGLTDERIRQLRQVDDYEYEIPAANGTKYQYYYYNSLVADSLEEAKLLIRSEVLKAAKTKSSTVQFICTDIDAYNEITSVLFSSSGENIITVLDDIKSEAENIYNTESIYHNINKNTLTVKIYLDYLD